MKSRATFLADFRQAEFPKVIDLTCPEAHMQKELRSLTRAHKRTETPAAIESGDVVTLALSSSLPRFNRPLVPVSVGSGLYDAELEAQLLGHAVGDVFTATVQGQDVPVTVKQATRTIFPEPTDEMAAEYAVSREGMEGVKTVEDFRRRVSEQYREERRYGAINDGIFACINYVLARSKWDYDEAELSAQLEERTEGLRQAAASEGMDYDTMTDEAIYRMFDVVNRAELETLLRQDVEASLARGYWLAVNHSLDPMSASLEEIRELDWGFLREYVENQIRFEN